jgi:hypothetical protein
LPVVFSDGTNITLILPPIMLSAAVGVTVIWDRWLRLRLKILRDAMARMTPLRRNLFRLWILCCLLWLAFILLEAINHPPHGNDISNVVVVFILPPIIFFLAGWELTRIWERFGAAHWFRLPENVRRGLTRLYLVVAVPWVAWYGYQILYASQHSGYSSQRAMSHDFWSLLIVPIGGPVLLLVIMWVFAGFRKSTPTSELEAATEKTPTAMDAVIRMTYGNSPPKKTANLHEAIQLAHGSLLGAIVDIAEVTKIGTQLYNGPMPYSTHDLAVATALNMFRSADTARHEQLCQIQMFSRMAVLDWLKEKKVNPLIVKSFEDTLYEMFKPSV